MSLFDNMPHTASIKKRVPTQDAYGGDTQAFTTTTSGVSCWVQVASQRDVANYRREFDLSVTHAVYFASDPSAYFGSDPAKGSKYVIVPDTAPFAGLVLEVRSNAEATAGMNFGWKVMVEYSPSEDLT